MLILGASQFILVINFERIVATELHVKLDFSNTRCVERVVQNYSIFLLLSHRQYASSDLLSRVSSWNCTVLCVTPVLVREFLSLGGEVGVRLREAIHKISTQV